MFLPAPNINTSSCALSLAHTLYDRYFHFLFSVSFATFADFIESNNGSGPLFVCLPLLNKSLCRLATNGCSILPTTLESNDFLIAPTPIHHINFSEILFFDRKVDSIYTANLKSFSSVNIDERYVVTFSSQPGHYNCSWLIQEEIILTVWSEQ